MPTTTCGITVAAITCTTTTATLYCDYYDYLKYYGDGYDYVYYSRYDHGCDYDSLKQTFFILAQVQGLKSEQVPKVILRLRITDYKGTCCDCYR